MTRQSPEYGTLIFDLESDGLLDTMAVIHNLCLREYESGEVFTFRNNKSQNNIEEGVEMLMDAETIVGHNIAAFDIPAIQLVYNWFKPEALVRDTLVMSRLIFSDQKDKDFRLWRRKKLPGQLIGSNTLKAWGYRLDLNKGDYMDDKVTEAKKLGMTDDVEIMRFVWAEWSQEMEDYCELDVDVTTKLWRQLLATNYPEFPIEFEHDCHDMAIMIEENGWPFDVKRAEKMADGLEKEMEELSVETVNKFGSWYAPAKKRIIAPLWDDPDGKNKKKKYAEPRAEFGEDNSRKIWAEVTVAKSTRKFKEMYRLNKKTGVRTLNNSVEEGAMFCPIIRKDFNPSSRHNIIDRFTTLYDWKPKDFTETGQPSISDDVLKGLVDQIPIAEQLSEIFYLRKRLSQVKTGAQAWLKHVKEDGAIHHRLNVGGTISGRCSHSSPNIAQVPKVMANKEGILKGRKGRHGWDSRRLFYVPEGWTLVGCDLSGIELRCLANLTAPYDDGALIREILEGDIHTTNQEAAGLDTRDQAKTFIYACVAYDTQVLSSKGWKYEHGLVVGDLVMTYNQTDNVKEWKPVLEKVHYENAEVIRMSNKQGFDIKSTPNHRWFINQRRRAPDYKRPYLTPMVKTTEELDTESNIIRNAPLRENREGLGEKSGLWNDIPKSTTDWVQYVLGLTQTELKSFLAGFMIADGYYQTGSANNGTWNWNQNNGNIQEAALLASYLSHNGNIHVSDISGTVSPMKVIHLSTKSHVTMQRMVKTNEPNQAVWCVRTENESVVIRQGNCITITGNTIYGAGNEKIGSIALPLGTAEEQIEKGKELKTRFYKKLPGLDKVMKLMKKKSKRGWIEGLDGRRLTVRAAHAALNLKLQNDAAMIAKKWMLLTDDHFLDDGLVHGWDGDYAFLGFIHDELQVAVRTELVEYAEETLIKSAAESGEFFDFAMPVDAEAKHGINWACTH